MLGHVQRVGSVVRVVADRFWLLSAFLKVEELEVVGSLVPVDVVLVVARTRDLGFLLVELEP